MVMHDYSAKTLLASIRVFLKETGMGEQYFGKRAAGISDIVPRLEAGGSVTLATAEKVQRYIARHRHDAA